MLVIMMNLYDQLLVFINTSSSDIPSEIHLLCTKYTTNTVKYVFA